MSDQKVRVYVIVQVGDSRPLTVGHVDLEDRELAGSDVAAVLREVADETESIGEARDE